MVRSALEDQILVEWADGWPFIWLDDEMTDADREWVSARHHGRALLHHVAPSCSRTVEDIQALDDWLQTR
jgi:hypothetical protein